MQFTELMLLYTRPLYWEPHPPLHAQRLKELLLYLLDPEQPGFGALQVRNSDGEAVSGWLRGEDAVRWIRSAYEEVWLPGAQLLQARRNEAGEEAYHLYLQYRAEVFLDKDRLAACILTAVPPGTHLGFYVDWYSPESSLLWTPQLRIYNYWPHNRRLAPDPPDGVLPPEPMSAREAADVLSRNFWGEVASGFRGLRYDFMLGVTPLVPGPQRFMSPVFFYAKPESSLDKPEDLLSPENLSDLEALSRKSIGTHDLLSEDVTGAFLQGNLVTFRQEPERDSYVRAHYLVVPWLSTVDQSEEVEDELCSVAQNLATIEFDAGYQVGDIMAKLATPEKLMNSWEYTLEGATSIARDLQDVVEFKPGSRRNTMTFQLVRQLRSSVSRVEVEMNNALRLEKKWRAAVEHTRRFARKKLTARQLPSVAPLLENLGDTGPYQLYEEEVNRAAQRVPQLREQFNSIISTLQDTLEQERRGEQEREEQRGRILNRVLVILAAVTAFPILIGQLDWNDLQREMQYWPALFQFIGGVLQDWHTHLVFVAMMLSAFGIILVVFSMMVYSSLRMPPLWRRGGELSRTGKKIVKKIATIEQLVKEANPAIQQLRKVASVSSRLPDPNELESLKVYRRKIDAKDEQACELLVEVSDWLGKGAQEPGSDSAVTVRTLRTKVEQFIIKTELLDTRPVPFPLPVALCLYRYKYDAVSDFEFTQVLNWYGFRDEEVKAIKEIAEKSKHRPVPEFLRTLRKSGVSALHETTVKSPADRFDIGGHALLAQNKLSPVELRLENGR